MEYVNDDALAHILFLANHFQGFDPEEIVKLILLELNVSVACDGWHYLNEGIILFRMDTKQNVTKELYPEIADRFKKNVTKFQVERSIRTAIHKAWSERDDAVWRRYFAGSNNGSVKRPTNAEFISRIAVTIDFWTACCRLLESKREATSKN